MNNFQGLTFKRILLDKKASIIEVTQKDKRGINYQNVLLVNQVQVLFDRKLKSYKLSISTPYIFLDENKKELTKYILKELFITKEEALNILYTHQFAKWEKIKEAAIFLGVHASPKKLSHWLQKRSWYNMLSDLGYCPELVNIFLKNKIIEL